MSEKKLEFNVDSVSFAVPHLFDLSENMKSIRLKCFSCLLSDFYSFD